MAFDRYSLYPSRIGDMLLRQLEMTGINPAVEKIEITPGGQVDRGMIGTAFADPMIRFRTAQLDTLFAGSPAVSLATGYQVDTTGSLTAASLIQLQRRVHAGTFEAAGSSLHFVLTSSKGWLCVESIEADQDSRVGAQVNLAYWALSQDGDAVPITSSATTALTSTPTFGGVWFLSKATIGNGGSPTQLPGIQRASIRPGKSFVTKRGDGQAFATIGSVVARRPEIRLTINDLTTWQTLYGALFGYNQAVSARLNLYLQKGTPGGTRVAKATTSHYLFQVDTADVTPDDISVEGESDAGMEVVYRPTAAAISVTHSSAIS